MGGTVRLSPSRSDRLQVDRVKLFSCGPLLTTLDSRLDLHKLPSMNNFFINLKLCKILGSILEQIFDKSILHIDKFHIVGHSLGAHCASSIAQSMIRGNKTLWR